MPPQALETLRFHILSDDLDDADKATLQGIAARREGTEVAFYEPAKLLSAETLGIIDRGAKYITNHVTKSAYYRLLAADLLPPDVHRALYLDGDIVCTDSLGDLFETDLNGLPVGMCLDHIASQVRHYNRLEYSPAEGYFISAVILFDLDVWRKENLTQAMLDWLAGPNAKKRIFHDQDVINAVLHGRIFQLDFSYHVDSICFYVFYWIQEERNRYYASETQYLLKAQWPALLAATEHPRIVHTPGGLKFWHRECDNPFTAVWRYFCAQSPWANEPLQWQNPPPKFTAKTRIKRLGRKLFEALHLVEKRKPAGIPYPQEAYRIAQRVLDGLVEEDSGVR